MHSSHLFPHSDSDVVLLGCLGSFEQNTFVESVSDGFKVQEATLSIQQQFCNVFGYLSGQLFI